MNDKLEKSKKKSAENNMESLKRHKVLVILGTMFILIPIVVSVFMEWSWMDFGTQKAESWMSFWGGYLGAFIGLVAVIYTTNKQIENSKSIMLDQVKEQTKQIQISAEIHDELERNRIYVNTLLEKTLEFQKFTRDLESMYQQHSKKSIKLLDEKKVIFDLLIQRNREQKYEKDIENEAVIKYSQEENQKVKDSLKKFQELVDQLKESKEMILGISNAVFTYKVFVELGNKDSKAYLETINNILQKVNEFLEFSSGFVYLDVLMFPLKIEEIKRINNVINEFNDLTINLNVLFKSLNRQSGSHIEAVLEKIGG